MISSPVLVNLDKLEFLEQRPYHHGFESVSSPFIDRQKICDIMQIMKRSEIPHSFRKTVHFSCYLCANRL